MKTAELIQQLQAFYHVDSISEDQLTLLCKGQAFNADVYRFIDPKQKSFIIKTVAAKPLLVRWFSGKLFIHREFKMLKALQTLASVATTVDKIAPSTLLIEYIDGEPLATIRKADKKKLPTEFFLEAEEELKKMHQLGYVHLDLRNLGNIICTKQGKPSFIDFQTALNITYFPKRFQLFLQKVDLSGLCKAWKKVGAEPLDPKHQAFFDEFNSFRKFWILEGYWLKKKVKRYNKRKKNRSSSNR
jgi:tRNA A-37 threonylcarbamoyl transferase component Bud32